MCQTGRISCNAVHLRCIANSASYHQLTALPSPKASPLAAFKIAKVVDGESMRADSRKMEWDQVVSLSVKPEQRHVDLFVQTRQQLLPNTVLGIFQKLNAIRPDGVLLLCPLYISPRVAEMCREQNVSYLDSVGNWWVTAPGLFVHIAGRPNRPTVSRTVDPFSRKSSRIARALLTHPGKGWQVQQLAQQADVSLGLVSKVKTTLLAVPTWKNGTACSSCGMESSSFKDGQ